jgi:hypothetical protein
MQFTVGLKLKGRADRIVVVAEDALIAALKVKTEHPEAESCTSAHKIGGATHVTHRMRSPNTLIEEQIRQDSPPSGGLLPEHLFTNRMADGSLASPACQPQARPSAAIGGSR